MLIEFVERGIMYRELEKGERRKGRRREAGGRGEVEIQREPIEPATMKSRSRSRKRRKEKERREHEKEGEKGNEMRGRERERERKRDGARIERALYSDKMILSIVNAAVGIAGL